jgi:inner membrane protein
MDSLTQIVLGAAVGEIALGKKIGNRALIWGAIGGTIPDLDVIANSFMDPIESLAFHRGITHSIFFSVFGGAVFGWLVHRLYSSGLFASRGYKAFISIINALMIIGAVWGINALFKNGFIINPWITIQILLPSAIHHPADQLQRMVLVIFSGFFHTHCTGLLYCIWNPGIHAILQLQGGIRQHFSC